MKRFLLGASAVALILASCQKSEVIENVNDGNNQLTYGVFQGKPGTRATELTNAALEVDGVNFPIYAYRGAQNAVKTEYFREVLTYGVPTADQWNTSIPRFLTEKTPLQLYAFYAPGQTTDGAVIGAEYTEALLADTYPTLKYTIQTTPTDLVAASVNDNETNKIAIPFKHILSQINFGVKGYFGAQIKVANIKINQVSNEGLFTFDPAATDEWTEDAAKLADYDYTFTAFTTPGGVEVQNKWTDPNDESSIRYIFGDGGNWSAGSTGVEDVWYHLADGSTVKASDITAATTKLDNALMLMPQALAAGVTKAWVTFDYTIQDLEGKYIIGNAITPEKGQFDLNMGDTGAYADTWKANLRYLYVIDFTGYLDGQLLSFTVDVETNPWENYDKDDTNTGIVLLSSLDGAIFEKYISKLGLGGDHQILAGHTFSDIAWDWSAYSMPATFANTGDKFTVKFANVKFNGKSITITPPKGFNVSTDGTSTTNTPIVVKATTTVLTFTKI